MASDPIVFYPAFSSSYSYFAAHLIDEVAAKHGRDVLWRPVRLAHVHEHHYPEGRPLRLKVRLEYMKRGAERAAELLGLPFRWTGNNLGPKRRRALFARAAAPRSSPCCCKVGVGAGLSRPRGQIL